ncbi:AAA family ATPase [uncultured Duncaniella sp.]|uniref:AAA family ATPase n=1 Tax=uncultured Duncaniella sp. TaxID=2768039 RepID=UPI0025A9C76A|nr:AAA family ATPase [uncultured Duncaniella sp.]
MKDVKIRIKSLGAVANSEIDLRPLMIFMGESGLGKSYVAFLAHYVYIVLSTGRLEHLFDAYNFKEILEDVKDGDTFLSIPAREIFDWINKDAISYIGYLIGHDTFSGEVEIEWPIDDETFEFTYTEEMAGLNNEESVIYHIQSNNFTYNVLSDRTIADPSIFATLIRAELSEAVLGIINPSEYILPPSRGSLMELNERPAFRSGMYEEFFNLKAALVRPSRIKKTEDQILDAILQKINNGKLTQADSEITYTTLDGVPMPLTAAASSVKELAPFTMMLNKFNLERISILFEEPEAHLHPERQQHVADSIAYAVAKGSHIQITTHSDYLIKRLNLLIRLFLLTEHSTPVRIKNVLEESGICKESFIDPKNIGAYLLVRNGDGSSRVEKFDIIGEGMIPFNTFHKTIENEFTLTSMLDDLFDE